MAWSTPRGEWWAPLHDFEPETQLELIAACAQLDRDRGHATAWPTGRGA